MQTSSTHTYVKGLDLCEQFYFEVIRPLLQIHFPSAFSYTAALVGNGSEVLGYDTDMSTDHDWGPRCMLFLGDEDVNMYGSAVEGMLQRELPPTFLGYPTLFTASTEQEGNNPGVQVPYAEVESVCATSGHKIVMTSPRLFARLHLGLDVHSSPLSSLDWLALPEQKLLALTAGRIFEQYECPSRAAPSPTLAELRLQFSYYPKDVWLYIVAAYWSRIENEGQLMCRCGTVGDEIGSAIIAARLVKSIMQLCFLYEKKYAPYPKWFGTAFNQLDVAKKLSIGDRLTKVISASDWSHRHCFINETYELLAEMHNSICATLGCEVRATVIGFHGRPFNVISLGEVSKNIAKCIEDPLLRKLVDDRGGCRPIIGSIDAFCDNCNLTEDSSLRSAILELYFIP